MLELYQLESCPYCRRVRDAMADLGIDYMIRNEPAGHHDRVRVKKLSGQTFVPTLHDPERNVIIADDDDKIVDYLREHYGRRTT